MGSRSVHRLAVVRFALALAICPSPAHAGVLVTIGDSWGDRPDKLQGIIDATYGPGRIRVGADYVGARDSDPDPMAWLDTSAPVLQVREISGQAHRADLGWYLEEGDDIPPVIDGVDDGPVFVQPSAGPSTAVLRLRTRGLRVGFYLRSADPGTAQGPQRFFTNRRFNDPGPAGTGALHAPEGGDVQALVFDVSAWTRPNTWLVCFEDRDSGALPGPCCATTDNDYADYVFEVRTEAITPTVPATFGALKSIYR